MKGFIATAEFEETISFYGESDTPQKALSDFLTGGEFKEHCEAVEASVDDEIEVCIYHAVYNGSPEWDDDIYSPEWEFALGKKVDTKLVAASL